MVRQATVDSGVVSAAAEGDVRVRAHLLALARSGVEVVAPAVVVAESTTGHAARDAKVNRVLAAGTAVRVEVP